MALAESAGSGRCPQRLVRERPNSLVLMNRSKRGVVVAEYRAIARQTLCRARVQIAKPLDRSCFPSENLSRT